MAGEDGFEGATESFKRSGHFWRLLSLIQFPICVVLLVYFVNRYLGADTIVDVPEAKTYEETKASGIPDKEYINAAQNIGNLIGTFQPTTARDQFESARGYMLDSALPYFDETQMKLELNTAEQSDISQILYIDHTTLAKAPDGSATVCLAGFRQRLAGQTVMPQQEVTYCFKLAKGEPTDEDPFGLRVSEFTQTLGKAQPAPIPKKVSPTFEPSTEKQKRGITGLPSSFPNGKKGG